MQTIDSTATHASILERDTIRTMHGPVDVHLAMNNGVVVRLKDGIELRLSPAIVEAIVDQYQGVTR